MSCFSPNTAIVGSQKDGRSPSPEDSRSVVGPDLVIDSLSHPPPLAWASRGETSITSSDFVYTKV